MGQFLRLIDDGIVDFFVQQAEDSCYGRNQFLKHSPYLLCYRKLDGLPGNFPDLFLALRPFLSGMDEGIYISTIASRRPQIYTKPVSWIGSLSVAGITAILRTATMNQWRCEIP